MVTFLIRLKTDKRESQIELEYSEVQKKEGHSLGQDVAVVFILFNLQG